jgi:nucleotide-binding universal stress UspA family protein
MLRNILVPVDGSSVGEAALPYARALARRSGAMLSLVRAARAPIRPLHPGEGQREVVADAESYLAALAARLTDEGFCVETGVPYGAPAAWIPAEVELRRADAIVMATHDRSGPARWVQGSIAEAVVNHARVPVVVVRAHGPDEHSARLAESEPTLVVPLDGSRFAEAALAQAQAFALMLNARVVLLGVVPEPTRPMPDDGALFVHPTDDHARDLVETRSYLAKAAALLPSRLIVETIVRVGDAASEIALEAKERGAAAVIMASHGRTGVARTILGSVAGAVLHRGETPVILVHPPHLPAGESAATKPVLTTA